MQLFEQEIQVRVRYSETDQMGFVYYGNYSSYFEVARVEWLRNYGVSYKELEQQGILMPVVHYSIDYLKPAFYDDLLTIKVWLEEMPTNKIKFAYETYNEAGEVLNKGKTILVFLSKETMKPVRVPEIVMNKLKQ